FETIAYDDAGRISQITNGDGITNYVFDDRGQLTSADRSGTNLDEAFSYDPAGNRTLPGYQTLPGNRLQSDGTYQYTYDNEGNLVLQTEMATGNTREFQWDHRNRLIAVIDKDASGTETQRVTFGYDALDHRIAKEVQAGDSDVITH